MKMDNSVLPVAEGHNILHLEMCGRIWHLERAADLEALWEEMVLFDEDERLPYWTEVWPASLVLAEWLWSQRKHIVGQRCLDLGCGIGATALVGQWLGAHVLAMDYEPQALIFAQKNAHRNQVANPDWLAMDWRKPALKARSVSFMWGGDVMYESRFAAAIFHFLDHVLTQDGVFWLAEPNRSVYEAFRALLHERRWRCRRVLETQTAAVIPQEKAVPVSIWEITR